MIGEVGNHLYGFMNGLLKNGSRAEAINYLELDITKNPFKKNHPAKLEKLRNRRLMNFINQFEPDIIIFCLHNLIFDLKLIKEEFNGLIIFMDVQGTDWKLFDNMEFWINDINLLLTVSKRKMYELHEFGYTHTMFFYPGIDTDYYHPKQLNNCDLSYYGSPISFVGRPSIKRVDYLENIVDLGLVVWGKKWNLHHEVANSDLRACQRSKVDVEGLELNRVCSATNVLVNIHHDDSEKKIPSLTFKDFIAPSAECCMLTEHMDEIEDLFDIGTEVITFANKDDFIYKAEKFSKDKDLANKIGRNARIRCLSQHSHEVKARELINFLSDS